MLHCCYARVVPRCSFGWETWLPQCLGAGQSLCMLCAQQGGPGRKLGARANAWHTCVINELVRHFMLVMQSATHWFSLFAQSHVHHSLLFTHFAFFVAGLQASFFSPTAGLRACGKAFCTFSPASSNATHMLQRRLSWPHTTYPEELSRSLSLWLSEGAPECQSGLLKKVAVSGHQRRI